MELQAKFGGNSWSLSQRWRWCCCCEM